MLFSCYKVARIIAFVQCLQADIAPFIIHTENKEEYEGRLDSPARLEQLFRVEHRVLIVVLFSQIIGDCLKTGNWILSAETPISTNPAL